MKLKAYPVSAVNSYISQYLAEDAFLDSIMVMGEYTVHHCRWKHGRMRQHAAFLLQ